VVIDPPDGECDADTSAATVAVARPQNGFAHAPATPSTTNHQPARVGNRLLMGIVGLVAAAAAVSLARLAWNPSSARPPEGGGAVPSVVVDSRSPQLTKEPLVSPVSPVEIHIAYGTEKQKWLDEATAEFEKTPAGSHIKVNLHGMGSVEAAQAVLSGPSPYPIHVWSPASSAYRDLFEREWRAKHEKSPIIRSENLALTPMVFLMWESRHGPFAKKYGRVTFESIGKAISDPGGWQSIAGQSRWGRFKFGHTHPNRSNSGLLTLVLMAYEHSRKETNLSLTDISQPAFLDWLRTFEQGVVRPNGSLIHSTGTLMREMVLRGPSQYDCVLVYENLAIDYLEAARDRWGELRVDYPEPNIWNEHPYYILDVPWSNPDHRTAAGEYLAFLMSRQVQQRALEHGFRPGSPEVSVRSATSPLIKHAEQGLKIELPRMCEPPRAETVKKLLDSGEQVQ
jgi:Ca-activated chloride channel family protein